MSIEAALVVPIFLFAFLNLLGMMEIYDMQMRLQAALHQTAKELAVEGYAYRQLQRENGRGLSLPMQAGFSESYVRSSVQSYVTADVLDRSVIENGRRGMLYSFSKIMEDDRVELRVIYRIVPRFTVIPFGKVWTMTQAKVRAFTGYDTTKASAYEGEEDIYVYVTESGSAYHMDRRCSHLRLTIQLASIQEVKSLRNDEGGRYAPCEICHAAGGDGDIVLITNLGSRYHKTAACPGLKRTIRAIPRKEAGAYYACSRCALGS